MTFITEYASEQDIEKYGLQAINERDYGGHGYTKWTIDREQDIYIRYIRSTREEPFDTTYSFYWKGHVLRVVVRSHSSEGKHGGPLHSTVELVGPPFPWGMPIWLPPELEGLREQITNAFKAAYLAERISDSVVSGAYTGYTVTYK